MGERVIKEYPEEIPEITEEGIKKYIEGISENNPAFVKDGSKNTSIYTQLLSLYLLLVGFYLMMK